MDATYQPLTNRTKILRETELFWSAIMGLLCIALVNMLLGRLMKYSELLESGATTEKLSAPRDRK